MRENKLNKLTERTDAQTLSSREGARELGGDVRETAQDSTDPTLSRREPPDRPTGWDKPWQEDGSLASEELDDDETKQARALRRKHSEDASSLEEWARSGFSSWSQHDSAPDESGE